MVGGISGSCISWLVMGLHGGLYAACAVSLGNVLISWTYLIRQRPELLKLAMSRMFSSRQPDGKSTLSWRHEVWPLQWRSAITWGAGYFIFQIFTPVLFHFQGAAVAGQMGMTMSASNALLAVCVTWITAKSPEFGKHIALRQWAELDRLFFKVFRESAIIVCLGAGAGWLAIYLMKVYFTLGQRFLPSLEVAVLLTAMIFMIINNCFAVYLRAHKQEPLMLITVIASALYGLSTFFMARLYSSMGVVVGFLAITVLFCLPAIYTTWKKCRHVWHESE
jgi:hypothetical protein